MQVSRKESARGEEMAQLVGGQEPAKAGLLNASPQNQFLCDVHPSQSGQQLLAHTVENTYAAAAGD